VICPKCALEQPEGGLECGACGVVFAKLGRERPPARGATVVEADEPETLWERARALVLAVPDSVNPFVFGGRVVVWLIFFVWGLRFITVPLARERLASSFMHSINLPFHEAGHIVFMPFGSFMTSLGGSLFQVALPLGIGVAFLVKNHEPFSASIMLWWAGQNLMDLAPYIGDARALQMVLLGGHTGAEVEGHDWEAILTALGWLQYDRALARFSYGLGILLIVASLAWGGYILFWQSRRLERF
jgi:hypothetical protein